MSSLSQYIVDILRRGKEDAALNKGGLTIGTPEQIERDKPKMRPVQPGLPIKDDPERILRTRREQLEAAMGAAGA